MSNPLVTAAAFVLALASTANAGELTYEFYGGAGISPSSNYDGINFDLDSGFTYGSAVYKKEIAKSVDLGLDMMVTNQGYADYATSVESTSLMLNARYNFPIGTKMGGFVGLGLGVVNVTYNGQNQFPAFTGSKAVAGGQIEFGLGQKISDNKTIFAMLKHQVAFEAPEIVAATQELKSTNLLIGLQVSF